MTTPTQLGTILSVWAHPDDETYCAGAIMAAAARNGQRAICITATKGELGVQDSARWPAEQLGEIREHEMVAALAELGLSEHMWLGYRDGGCAEVPEHDPVFYITDAIEKYRVDSVLTFGPEGFTGHPDHQAVSRWVSAAVHRAARKPAVYHQVQLRDVYEQYLKAADEKLDIFFNIDKPPLYNAAHCDICFRADDELVQRKYRALQAMPSQTTSMLEEFPMEKFAPVFGAEAFVRAERNR